MKKCIYLVLVLLVMAGVVSCKKDSVVKEPEKVAQPTGVMRSVTITAGQGETRISVSSGKHIWSKGEKLNIVPVSGDFGVASLDIIDGIGSASGTFDGKMDSGIKENTPLCGWVDEVNWGYENGELQYWLSSNQVYVENLEDVKYPVVGTGSIEDGISLKNPFGILCLDVNSELTYALNNIEVVSESNNISGWFKINPITLSTDGIEDKLTGKYVRMDCGQDVGLYEASVKFYILIPAGTYDANDLTVKLNMKDYSEQEFKLRTITITAGSVTTVIVSEKLAARPTCQSALDDDSNWVEIGGRYWLKENTRCIEYDTESEACNAAWLINNTIPTSEGVSNTPYYTPIPVSKKTYYMSEDQFDKLGMLYNWAAAVGVADGSTQTTAFTDNRQGICPNGSHIPTVEEWNDLANALGGKEIAGKKVKSTSGWNRKDNVKSVSFSASEWGVKSTSGWNRKGNSTDEYGFAALPAGAAHGSDVDGVGDDGYFWTATPNEAYNDRIYICHLVSEYGLMYNIYNSYAYGHSVRCIRDYPEEVNTPVSRPVCQSALDDDKNWVKIGSQYWLRENTKCIAYDTNSEAYNAAWLRDNTIPESSRGVYTPYYAPIPWSKKPFYMTEDQFCKLGMLYNWAAAVGVADGRTQKTAFAEKRQGICPNGSHIPSLREWSTLVKFLGGKSIAGKKMKTSTGWESGGNKGEGDNGFAALPAGCVFGDVGGAGGNTVFLTANPDETGDCYVYGRDLYYNDDSLIYSSDVMNLGGSVRCIKD